MSNTVHPLRQEFTGSPDLFEVEPTLPSDQEMANDAEVREDPEFEYHQRKAAPKSVAMESNAPEATVEVSAESVASAIAKAAEKSRQMRGGSVYTERPPSEAAIDQGHGSAAEDADETRPHPSRPIAKKYQDAARENLPAVREIGRVMARDLPHRGDV